MKNYSILIRSLTASALFVFIFSITANAQAPEAQLISGPAAGSKAPVRYLEKDVMDLINKQRADNGLAPLNWNAKAAEVARVHSRDMGWNNYFNHRSLDGKMVNDRADAIGLFDWQMIGENIAMLGGFKDPIEHVVEGWMQSPGHRKNILDPRWKDTGIGIFINSEGTYYFTQVFLLKK